MSAVTLREALATQAPSGAFAARVWLPDGPLLDHNAFCTALTALELLRWPRRPEPLEAARRALAWLEGCGREGRRGVYGFYPWCGHPDWMGERLPADVDDTALVHLLRLALGESKREPAWALHVAMEGQRLTRSPRGASPWILAGLYTTWLDGARLPNPVDLCANLNVAALRSRLGCAEPHVTVLGAAWASGLAALEAGRARPEQLAPYYPHPGEWEQALRRAIVCGAHGLSPLLAPMRRLAQSCAPGPLCSSAGGLVRWDSPALSALRACPDAPDTSRSP